MLTPTDVHHLVGFLTLVSKPDDVTVELGSVVYDAASSEGRDVDVTVTAHAATGAQVGYSGIEVKSHKRPLDSTHVEQLSCKMGDMPSLTERAIVSASGFSAPAIRKAAKHGVDLLELRPWNDTSRGFDHFRSTCVPSVQRYLQWDDDVAIHINPNSPVSREDHDTFRANPRIHFETPEPDHPADLQTLVENLREQATRELMKRWNPANIDPNQRKQAEVTAVVSNRPWIDAVTGRVPVNEIRFSGKVRWREEQVPTESHALFRYGESSPIAGACVFEMPGWGLCGLLLSQTDRNLRFVNIPISHRNITRIFRHQVAKG